jgi:hypothetical protein
VVKKASGKVGAGKTAIRISFTDISRRKADAPQGSGTQ